MSDSDSELNEWVNSYTSKSIITTFKKKTIHPLSLVVSKAASSASAISNQALSNPVSSGSDNQYCQSASFDPAVVHKGNNCQDPSTSKTATASYLVHNKSQSTSNSEPSSLPSITNNIVLNKARKPATSDPGVVHNGNNCQDPSTASDLVRDLPQSASNSEPGSLPSITNNIVLNKTRKRGRTNNSIVVANTEEPNNGRHRYNTRSNNPGPLNLVVKIRGPRAKKASVRTTFFPANSSPEREDTAKQSNVEVVDINDPINDKSYNEIQQEIWNYETNIKIIWKSGIVIRFPIRRFQKLQDVFAHLMRQEKVKQEQIYLRLDGVPVQPSDTPFSLNLTVCDFLEGGIVKKANNFEVIPQKITPFFLNFQYGDKQVIPLPTNKTEPLKKLMLIFSEQIKKPLRLIKFRLDGEVLYGSETPESLDLEKGDVIDVLF